MMSEDIYFEVAYYDDPCEFDPYVSIVDPPFNRIKNLKEYVIHKPNITLEVKYPLRDKFLFPLYSNDDSGFTREQLVKSICNLYKWIYQVEEKTSDVKTGQHPAFYFNRNQTYGYFGIWGHGIEDLDLHTIYYDSDRDVYTLGIDS